MKKTLIIPFALMIVVLTIRTTTFINNEPYYDNFKNLFKKDINIIEVSKKYLGTIEKLFFKEESYNVSTNDKYYELLDGSIYVITDTKYIYSKVSGICIGIKKIDGLYEVKIQTEQHIITYTNLYKCNLSMYTYVNANDIIGELKYDNNYNYVIRYED